MNILDDRDDLISKENMKNMLGPGRGVSQFEQNPGIGILIRKGGAEDETNASSDIQIFYT